MNHKLSLWEKIKAYHLKNNCIVLIVLCLIFLISFLVYLQPKWRNNDVIANIALACFTSLLATILAMCAEIYVQFKSSENDQFLEDIHTFGIANLNKNKEVLLRELLQDCDKEFWISGYRLILTRNLRPEIESIVKRGVKIKALLCPPWTEAFRLVYGEREKVMDNYFEVLHVIRVNQMSTTETTDYDIRFIEKPLFSDTYKVDMHLVSGPYMHNRDQKYNRIMAKDFFSYNLIKKSELYTIVETEYLTLMDEASLVLDWEKFDSAYQKLCEEDLRESEKMELLKSACEPFEQPA
jgi:hypothetical protein